MADVVTNVADLERRLRSTLSGDALTWFSEAVESVKSEPRSVERLFPAVSRRCGRDELGDGWAIDDAVRVVLIATLTRADEKLTHICEMLYRYGDANEKRGVLRALSCVPVDAGALAIVTDALRANDVRLIAAA